MDDANIKQVQGIIQDWAAAVHRRDIQAVIAHHAADFLMFDVVGPLRLTGLDDYRKTWVEQFFPWHGGTGRFDLRDLAVTADARLAFATALLDCAGTEAGKPVGFTLRLTVCLKRSADDWLIVHEHHSEPLHFDSHQQTDVRVEHE